jgi:hypothetical protein
MSSDIRDGSSITGFYVTGSSFQTRPTLSPPSETPCCLRTILTAGYDGSRLSVSSYGATVSDLPCTHLRRTRPLLADTDDASHLYSSTQYDRSPPAAERMDDLSCRRFQSSSRARRTLPVPDTDPADEAELIPTLPSPPLHTTHRLAEGDHSSLLHPEHSGTFRCNQLAMPEPLNVF